MRGHENKLQPKREGRGIAREGEGGGSKRSWQRDGKISRRYKQKIRILITEIHKAFNEAAANEAQTGPEAWADETHLQMSQAKTNFFFLLLLAFSTVRLARRPSPSKSQASPPPASSAPTREVAEDEEAPVAAADAAEDRARATLGSILSKIKKTKYNCNQNCLLARSGCC
jgi:hypothetical protein